MNIHKKYNQSSIIAMMLFIAILLAFIVISFISCEREAPNCVSEAPGLEWSVRSTGIADVLYSIAWSGTRFVAVGDSSIFSSPDGYQWDLMVANTPGELFRVIWTNHHFIAVGEGIIYLSPDGDDWEVSFGVGTLYDVAAMDSLVVATGDSGLVVLTKDLLTWDYSYSNISSYAVICMPDHPTGIKILATGKAGMTSTSIDGMTWTVMGGHPIYNFRTIAYHKGFCVIGGDNGEVRYALDRLSNFRGGKCASKTIRRFIFGNNEWIGIGDSGIVISSEYKRTTYDIDFYERYCGHGLDLYDIIWTGVGYIAVGDSGIILASPSNIKK
jgi:hypothetical protein